MLGIYLIGVVYLVRRQITQLEKEEEDEEDKEEDLSVVIDKQEKTDIKTVNKVVNDAKEVFIWKSASQNNKEIEERNSTKFLNYFLLKEALNLVHIRDKIFFQC